jgi:branched-chain amino acid transport system ATP-binding protein
VSAATTAPDPLLEVSGLSKAFTGVRALADVSFRIEHNEVLAILGPNGSGKTTLFNVVSGFMRPTAGTIRFLGHSVGGKSPRTLVAKGLTRSFQQSMAFKSFTVRDNLAIAQLSMSRHARKAAAARQDELLELCGLSSVADVLSASLPYGHQRKLGVAIALATEPKLIMLDEPGAGLSDDDTEELAQVIRSLPPRGVSVACIDHNLPFLLPIADRVVVLDAGNKVFEGTPADARRSQRVIEAYLGSYDAD